MAVLSVGHAGHRHAHRKARYVMSQESFKQVRDLIREWVDFMDEAWVVSPETVKDRLREELGDDVAQSAIQHFSAALHIGGMAIAPYQGFDEEEPLLDVDGKPVVVSVICNVDRLPYALHRVSAHQIDESIHALLPTGEDDDEILDEEGDEQASAEGSERSFVMT